MSSIFVIAFDVPRPAMGVQQALNYWHRAEGTPQTIDTWDGNPHYVSRMRMPVYNRPIISSSIEGVPFTVETSEEPNFIGKFTTPVFNRFQYSPANDLPPPPPSVDTPTHFIGRFTAPTFNRAINSWSADGQPFVVDTVGANPHFIGKFTAPTLQRIPYNSWCVDFPIVPAQDNPVNFIGKFKPVTFFNSVSYLGYDSSTVFVPPSFPTLGGKTEKTIKQKQLEQYTVKPFYVGDLSRLGGIARAQALTAKQRNSIAKKAASIRWQ
jgi:hypothetical protein